MAKTIKVPSTQTKQALAPKASPNPSKAETRSNLNSTFGAPKSAKK